MRGGDQKKERGGGVRDRGKNDGRRLKESSERDG